MPAFDLIARLAPTVAGAVFVASLLAGCSAINQYHPPMHAVVTRNVGQDRIRNVTIRYAGPIIFRDITPRYPRSYQTDIGDRPVPEIAHVSWTMEDGRSFAQDVPLLRYVWTTPGRFAGFEFRFDGPRLEVYREARMPDAPLSSTYSRIFPD
ncbi:hypothetical protein E4K72_07885 [Oxalobacteraceae bacterium OM1]|nr:hypothetical protein E4K72_07885 [Oxalobacteraceae bacterium OM1]